METARTAERAAVDVARVRLWRKQKQALSPRYSGPYQLALAANPSWQPAQHVLYLERLLVDAVEGRGAARLIVTLPPRHAKSTVVSHYLPAWYLSRWPERQIVLASYEARFASRWGRRAREVVERMALGIRLRRDVTAADQWETLAGGGMTTAGVGGPITGYGAHLLVIDDPVKNAEEARSAVFREKVWDWWLSTASTRLEPGAVVVLLMTRWHEDDLAGRLIRAVREVDDDDREEQWAVINLPAIACEDDPLGRAPGEALWPERFPLHRLERRRERLGSYWWSALYQQSPIAEGGGAFQRQWFRVVQAAPPCERYCRFWDFAGTCK